MGASSWRQYVKLTVVVAWALVVAIPGSQGFATTNLGQLRLQPPQQQQCLKGSSLSLQTEHKASNKRKLWRNNWDVLRGVQRQRKPTLVTILQENESSSSSSSRSDSETQVSRSWRRVFWFMNQAILSIWKRRLARLAALSVMVMMGQSVLGVCPAVATTTSSVGLLTQTTGGPLVGGGGASSLAAPVSNFARGTTAAAATMASTTLRSFNLPGALMVLLVAALTGGLVGKILPSRVKDGSSVLQLRRKPKEEEEEATKEVKVLQLTRTTPKPVEVEEDDEVEFQVAAAATTTTMSLLDERKEAQRQRQVELELRRQKVTDDRKKKAEGERLLEQTFSRYQSSSSSSAATMAPAATVAVAAPSNPKVYTDVQEEEFFDEEEDPMVFQEEVALAEDDFEEFVHEPERSTSTALRSSNRMEFSTYQEEEEGDGDELELRREGLAKPMAGGVLLILAVGAAVIQSAATSTATLILPFHISTGLGMLLIAAFGGVLVGTSLLPSSSSSSSLAWWDVEEKRVRSRDAVAELPQTVSSNNVLEAEVVEMSVSSSVVTTTTTTAGKNVEVVQEFTTTPFVVDAEWERKRQELVQSMAGGVAILFTVAALLQ
ncbi:hypothetical protein ACA910_020588 [Epithemia clementina (nom. ined.)]